jgi:hypothetical protein
MWPLECPQTTRLLLRNLGNPPPHKRIGIILVRVVISEVNLRIHLNLPLDTVVHFELV